MTATSTAGGRDEMACRSCGRMERASEGYPCGGCGTFLCLMCEIRGVARCARCAAAVDGRPAAAPPPARQAR